MADTDNNYVADTQDHIFIIDDNTSVNNDSPLVLNFDLSLSNNNRKTSHERNVMSPRGKKNIFLHKKVRSASAGSFKRFKKSASESEIEKI